MGNTGFISRLGLRLGACLFILFTLQGCKEILKEGVYRGVLIQAASPGALRAEGPTSPIPSVSQQDVLIVSTKLTPKQSQLTISDPEHPILYRASIRQIRSGHYLLEMPPLFSAPVPLKIDRSFQDPTLKWNCVTGDSTESRWVKLCRNEDRFLMQISKAEEGELLFDLSGTYSSVQVPIPFDIPKNFTLSEALSQALKQNFHCQIQVQHTLQSVFQARSANLALLPGANTQALLALGVMNPYNIASFVGFFFPFMIPTKWWKADEAGNTSKIGQLGLQLARLNLINEVEKLSFILTGDLRVLKVTEHELESAAKFFTALKSKKGKERFAWRFSHVIAALRMEIARLKQTIKMDRIALSGALGFPNPMAVQNVILEDDFLEPLRTGQNPFVVRGISPLSGKSVARMGVLRSLELRQFDYLINSAQIVKKSLYFGWLDPRTPPTQSLSFGLIDQVKSAKSVVEEMKLKRSEREEMLINRVYQWVTTYNNALETFPIAQVEVEYQTQRLRRLREKTLDDLPDTVLDVTYLELKDSLKSKIDYYAKLEASLTSYWISRSNIRRILLSDAYSQTFPLPPNQNIWPDQFSDQAYKRTEIDEKWEGIEWGPGEMDAETLPSLPPLGWNGENPPRGITNFGSFPL